MKLLFIGGTGNISVSASRLAVARGFELYLLNRGHRPVTIAGAKTITADIKQPEQVAAALGGQRFDVVVNWIAYHVDEIERDLALFGGKCGQYLFISSASCYQKPATYLITDLEPDLRANRRRARRQTQAGAYRLGLHRPDRSRGGAAVLGDKMHNAIFDNNKIKRFVPDYVARIPFHLGIRRTLAWYQGDPSRIHDSPEDEAQMERVLAAYQKSK